MGKEITKKNNKIYVCKLNIRKKKKNKNNNKINVLIKFCVYLYILLLYIIFYYYYFYYCYFFFFFFGRGGCMLVGVRIVLLCIQNYEYFQALVEFKNTLI